MTRRVRRLAASLGHTLPRLSGWARLPFVSDFRRSAGVRFGRWPMNPTAAQMSERRSWEVKRVQNELAAERRSASERRSVERTAKTVALDAVALDVPGQPELRIESTDMSTLGMAFNASRQFREGERVAVKFRLVNGAVKLMVCRTRYCRAIEGGRFHVGVEFVNGVLPSGVCALPASPRAQL